MDRRRGIPSRPVSSEEVDCWSHAAESLIALTNKYSNSSTIETIGRVNRLISAWPQDDALPAEGFDGVKTIYKKLTPGLHEIRATAEDEARAIEDAIERIGVLIALRKAPEALPPEKRIKRPRVLSPSGTPVPPAVGAAAGSRGVSITLPARSSVGPSPPLASTRDTKVRREAYAKQLPLQQGRKVAFHPPPGKSANGGTDTDENTWILALVTKCLSAEKNKYEVQDPEPQEDGQPGLLYTTTLKSIIPLPDPNAAPGSPAHVSSYQDFPVGSTVMALYPDTSCFYRAEVVATPKDMQPSGRPAPSSKHIPTYKLKFEDDDNQEHSVAAQWVVEWPGGPRP